MTHDPILEHPKVRLRETALSLRAKLDIPAISGAIRTHLLAWPFFRRAGRILFYHPLPGEVDLVPLVALSPEKTWFLPTIADSPADKTSLTFRRYLPGDPLQRERYGILEPAADAAPLDSLPPDSLILLPGLGFDQRGYRLGFGKGYFDRFLQSRVESGETCVSVGVTPEALLHQALPNDPWDIPAKFIVTEAGVRAASPDECP